MSTTDDQDTAFPRMRASRSMKRSLLSAVVIGTLAPLSAFAAVYEAAPLLVAPLNRVEGETVDKVTFAAALVGTPTPTPTPASVREPSPASIVIVTFRPENHAPAAAMLAIAEPNEEVIAPVVEAEVPPPPAPPPTSASAATVVAPGPAGAPCGSVVCEVDEMCCSARCSLCVPAGGQCDRGSCGVAAAPASEPCGPNTCNVGQVCCNESCGICAAPGATCDPRTCDGPSQPFSEECGMNTCNVGTVCCDASCGLCAPASECANRKCLFAAPDSRGG